MDALNFAKWAGVTIGLLALLKVLAELGILGKTQEDKDTEALFNNPAAVGSPDAIPAIQHAIQQQTGSSKPPTKDQIKAKMPDSSTMLSWKNQLEKARGIFDDDESAVYNVIRGLKTNLAMYAFDQFFQVYEKKHLLDYLREFMNNDELAVVNSIVSKFKPA